MERTQHGKFEHSSDFKLASQLKSWMGINPSFGCIWDCAYCVQHKDKFYAESEYRKINRVCGPEDVIAEIMSNPRITSRTPLFLYNFSDPFLPHNIQDLRKILTGLDQRGFTNIVGLITRTFADAETLDAIANLRNIKPVVLLSFSGYENRMLEGGPISMRIKLAKELKKRKIPTLQYLRPIAREWLEDGQFEKARDAIGDSIDGVVMSGVRITGEIEDRLIQRNLPVPQVTSPRNKFFPKDLQEQVIDCYRNVVPVFRYTSCGVSATMNMPDYNAHLGFLRETQQKEFKTCPLPCKAGQENNCINCKRPDREKVLQLLARIGKQKVGFKITQNGSIILDSVLPKEALSFLRHNTSSHVDHKDNSHHVDQIAGMEVKTD